MAYGAILGQTPPSPVDTVASGNMNAVTSNAVYEALQNLISDSQIITGNYTGTGTYGENNPNSLTFNSTQVPKMLLVYGINDNQGQNSAFRGFVWIYNCIYGYNLNNDSSTLNSFVNVSYSNNLNTSTISWYSTQSSNVQSNNLGIQYIYIAFI